MAAAPAPAVAAAGITLDAARLAQRDWAARPLSQRLRVLRRARRLLAGESAAIIDLFPSTLARSRADSYAAEVLPLLDACRFLEREATHILAPRRLDGQGRPFWLGSVTGAVQRVPLGVVLIIGPGNYPLFLPGVQALQALAAGNAVVWKPGSGGRPLARHFAGILRRAGLPQDLLQVTDDSAATAIFALDARPDKVVFTGSSEAGRAVLLRAAENLIPVIAELSGCDACIVLPSADLRRVGDALEFAMRFNGSATCMAPRRLLLVGHGHDAFLTSLRARFTATPAVELSWATRRQLASLIEEARQAGATVHGSPDSALTRPILVENAAPTMRLAQTDIMAPILTVIHFPDAQSLLAAEQSFPLGLTASIFGAEPEARSLAARLDVGTVLINDLIVPTADPRIPFGGRRGSGFGVTRGAEGLLEMTAVKTTLTRHGADTRHFEPTDARHEELFEGAVALSHGTWALRLHGLRKILGAVRRLSKRKAAGESQ